MAHTQTAPQALNVPTGPNLPGPAPEPGRQATPITAVLGRLTWMLFGPFALVLCFLTLFGKDRGLFSFHDVIYFAVLGAMLLGRWVEFHSGHGLTAEGTPATAGQVRRYLLWTTAVGLALWGGACLFRVFVLTS